MFSRTVFRVESTARYIKGNKILTKKRVIIVFSITEGNFWFKLNRLQAETEITEI